MSVVIWGTDFTAEQLFNVVRQEEDVIGFIDNNPDKWGGEFLGKPIASPDVLKEKIGEIDKIYLGTSYEHFEDLWRQIKKIDSAFDEIFGIDKSNNIYKVDYSSVGGKPWLSYLEFDAVRMCNLNCRGCCHFSNIVTERGEYTEEEMVKDFSKLSELFENIEVIRIVGGEPLLNKNLDKIIYGIRSFFPKSKIEIVSNGLLVTSLSDEVAEAISKEEVVLCITQYEKTTTVMPQIKEFCKNKNINVVVFGYDRDEFKKVINLKGDSDGAHIFEQCISRKCTTLYKGKITHCWLEAYVDVFNKKYNTDIPEDQGIDLHAANSGEEIKEFLAKESMSCSYCTKPVNIDWSSGKNDALMDDWVAIY